MASAQSSFEWELSKENVQPLSGGRRIANLTAALQPQADQASRLRDEKQKFEIELRTYQGDDPLGVWYKYIAWVEQNYPSGGGANNKSQLLEQCVSQFKDEDRYHNDLRYIEVWIKFANVCNDANQIFGFMFNNSIGSAVAEFYIAWASELETLGNIKKADAIYKKGIEQFAQPRDLLLKRHADFQARVAARMAHGETQIETQSNQGPDSENRLALGGLKGHGKSKKVGSVRQSSSKSPALGRLTTPMETPNVKGAGIKIYEEQQENRPANLPPQTGEWAKVPIQSEANSENQLKAGKWTDGRGRNKSIGIGASTTPTATAPAFKVHTDEDPGLSTVTPRKLPPTVNQVLSARKPDKPKDPLQHLVGKGDGNAVSMPMYCKHLIYCGMKEFSFEELRAAVVHKKEEEEKKKRLEDERLQVERDLLMQREQLAQVMKEKMRMEEEVQRIRVAKVPPTAVEVDGYGTRGSVPALVVESPDSVTQQHMAETEEAQGTASGPKFSFTQPCQPITPSPMETDFAVPAPVRQGLIKPDIPTPDDKTANLLGISGFTSSSGSIQATPDNTSGLDMLKSGSSRSKPVPWEIAAPSPTTHTKDAMQEVLGMFNQTIGVDNAALGFDNSVEHEEPYMDPLANPAAPAFNLFGKDNPKSLGTQQPFSIYDENQRPESSSKKTPFTIFEDDNAKVTNAEKLMSAGPFKIYDENADSGRNKFQSTSAPSSQMNRFSRRGLSEMEEKQGASSSPGDERVACPISEQSIIMENGPLLEEGDVDMEDDPVIASQPYMTMMQDKNLEDLTFAPGFSSTQNFTKLARLVSTPFNPSGEAPSMSVPPVSYIQGDERRSYGPEKSTMTLHYTLGDTLDSGKRNVNETSEAHANYSKVPPQETTPEVLEETDAVFGQKRVSNLSPITECSDEDHKLGMSTMASIKPDNGDSHLPGNHASIAGDATSAAPVATPQSEKKHLMNQTCHEIDVTCYMQDETQDLLSQSVMINPYNDPFDSELITEFLNNLEKPIVLYPNYHFYPEEMPVIKAKKSLLIGKDEYEILDRIGEGAYAHVYAVKKVSGSQSKDKELVMKIQKPACPWEFYVTCELHRRIQGNPVASSFMTIDDAYFFEDGSCLVNELYPHGTILDIVNDVKGSRRHLSEPLILLLCIELLRILETMMSVDFIHGDIKPDNFLFRGFPTWSGDSAELLAGNTQCLKLIDFGRGIDMRMFPDGTTFGVTVETSGFQCIEMKTNRPWTYQADMFGIIGTMHVLIFNEYMNVRMQNGRWRTGMKFKRWFTSSEVVKKIFDEFLNVPSCTSLPNVSGLRKELEMAFIKGCGDKYSVELNNFKHFKK